MATKGPTSIKQAGFYYQRYDFEVASGVSVEETLEPAYWSHVGSQFREFDRLTLIAQDKAWTAELIVLSAGSGFANVRLLYAVDLTGGGEEIDAADDALEVKYNGPSDRYVIIRRKDNVKLQTGFATKADAQVAAANHQRLVNA